MCCPNCGLGDADHKKNGVKKFVCGSTITDTRTTWSIACDTIRLLNENLREQDDVIRRLEICAKRASELLDASKDWLDHNTHIKRGIKL